MSALAAAPSGLYLGGGLVLAGGKPSANVARWVPVLPTNLLVNSGFETATDGVTPDGWTVTPTDSSVHWSTAVVHTGAHALINTSTAGAAYNVVQDVPVSVGHLYGFTGWVNVPSTRSAFSMTPKIIWKDSSGTVLRTNAARTYTTATGDWDEFAVTAVAPTGAVTGEVTLAVSNLRASVAVNDLTFGAG